MSSLIENVLTLEREANDLVAVAQRQAQQFDKDTASQMEGVRNELAAATDQRVEAFRHEAETRHERGLEQAEREHQEAAAALDAIGAPQVQRCAEQVVAKFHEV